VKWHLIRAASCLTGIALWLMLVLQWDMGLLIFWHILIALVPAVIIFVPGLWRNICPMATTASITSALTPYKKIQLSVTTQHRLAVAATVCLLLIVPLRHFIFDHFSTATASMLAIAGGLAVIGSLLFYDKSAWCAGLCPIHPVEKFYGIAPTASFHNAQCSSCSRCVKTCPDAIKTPQHLNPENSTPQEKLMVSGFPGFVLGWFLIEDIPYNNLWQGIAMAYGYPALGMLLSMALFKLIKSHLNAEQHRLQIKVFIASTAIVYYWYTAPILLHMFEVFSSVRMSSAGSNLPLFIIWSVRIGLSSLLFWWLVLRKPQRRTWLERPPAAPIVLKHYNSIK